MEKKLFIAIFVAVIGTLGIYLQTTLTDAERHFQELRTQSYTDYLEALSIRSITREKEDDIKTRIKKHLELADIEARIKKLSARARITIYGSPCVVAAVAHFQHKYDGHISDENNFDSKKSLACVALTMRDDTFSDEIPGKHIGKILMGGGFKLTLSECRTYLDNLDNLAGDDHQCATK